MKLRHLTPFLLLAAGCGGGGSKSVDSQVNDTFRSVAQPYLAGDLWSEAECYDAGVWLPVPVMYAARTKNAPMMAAFRGFFDRMLDAVSELPSQYDLHRIQFAYCMALYIGEAQRNGLGSLIPPRLPEFVGREFKRMWNEIPAWQWDTEPFPGGVEEKVNWKLGPRGIDNYYYAINDDEMFTMCTAAELLSYARATGNLTELTPDLFAATALGVRVVKERGERTSEGGWLFNRGVWTLHKDYAYAGYTTTEPVENLPMRRPNIAEDSSHSNRWGAWLHSLEVGTYRSAEAAAMREVRGRLAWQILNRVVLFTRSTDEVNPLRVEFANYMDGHNGFYGWKFTGNGGTGYRPSELSGTPYIGWWGAVGGSGISDLYRVMADQFPLTTQELDLYSYETARYRNPRITDPASYQNGFRWMLCEMAAQLAAGQ
ncbi:MAG: hypothetical protein JNJ45_05210 [Chthonomonas sp.]|nr:hypothetical protein [Chthonomonas sp.]